MFHSPVVGQAHLAFGLVMLLAAACSSKSPTNEPITSCPMPDGGSSPSTGASPDAAQDTATVPPDTDTLAGIPTQQQATLTTVFKSPLVIEGLTADDAGNLYAAGRAGTPSCAVYRVSPAGAMVTVGNITSPCSPNGLAFNAGSDLFIGDGAVIYRLTPNDQTPPTATVFASGVPGANGLAFDKSGNLWVSDGTTGQGRVWKITSGGTVSEAFRVQPMANTVNAAAPPDGGTDSGVMTGGVGRDPRALPPGSLTITATTRAAADTAGSVPIVANGLAFAPDGSLFVADTARGARWKVTFDGAGNVTSSTGCDTTFTANTLCLDDVFVAHPILEGLDGIALDAASNVWGVANERNAIVVVSPRGVVRQVFRNVPDPGTMLRNTGPLEFPTSPFLVGKKLCVTQSDVSRRDNFPNTFGEAMPGGSALGKISCLDQMLPSAGLPLPVR